MQAVSNRNLADQAMDKAQRKLVPFILLMYVLAFLDRANIGFAKQALQLDTGLSDTAFALGAGIFFLGYRNFFPGFTSLARDCGSRLLSRYYLLFNLLV
ncbi:MAG: rhmT [Anaerospora sp.]|nr:rhmT [Anaerospora sp.]